MDAGRPGDEGKVGEREVDAQGVKRRRIHEPPPELTNEELRRRTRLVPANLPTLLRLPSGMLKQVTLEAGKTVSIGKFGSFLADEIIGRQFGPTYEIKADGKVETMNQDVAEALSAKSAVAAVLTQQRRVRRRTRTSMMTATHRRSRTRRSGR